MNAFLDFDRALHAVRLAQARAELAMVEARFKVRAVCKRRAAIAKTCDAMRRTLSFGEPANDR